MFESPIFIVGCPRSGTTLLRDLLRSHPRLTFPLESHFIPSLYRNHGDPKTEFEARRLGEKILSLHWIKAWSLSLLPSDFEKARTFREMVEILFQAWASKENKPRWGDKTPHYVMHLPLLHELFPSARILHIYRDGRDVALSWLKTPFEPRNMYTAALMWRKYVAEGRSAGRALPADCYLEVRYEELISSPRQVMEQVCTFVQEPFTPAVLQPSRLQRTFLRRRIFSRQPLRMRNRKEIVRANRDKWKAEMSPFHRRVFESTAGDMLETLGYETEGLARPMPAVLRIFYQIHQRVMWAASRLNSRNAHKLLATELKLRLGRIGTEQ
jgi:hypothetical protein